MTAKELNIGTVFRVVGEPDLWFKAGPAHARMVEDDGTHDTGRHPLAQFRGKEVEVVERPAEIGRSGDTLILRGGEVTLNFITALLVHRCTPGEPFTEIVLSGASFCESEAERPTAATALHFSINLGHKSLNRPPGSELLAYNGRVYGRATQKEVLGKSSGGGFRLVRKIDGARRLVLMGVLALPDEFALYDIIMEHFGPDAAPAE